MTKHGNVNQRTPQVKKTHGDPQGKKHQGDSTSKQASGTTSAPRHQGLGSDLIFPTVELHTGTTQATTTTTSAEDLQRTIFTTPHPMVPDLTEPPRAPDRDRGPDVETDILALGGVAPELAPSDFVS